jgi:hypothetical protein
VRSSGWGLSPKSNQDCGSKKGAISNESTKRWILAMRPRVSVAPGYDSANLLIGVITVFPQCKPGSKEVQPLFSCPVCHPFSLSHIAMGIK